MYIRDNLASRWTIMRLCHIDSKYITGLFVDALLTLMSARWLKT